MKSLQHTHDSKNNWMVNRLHFLFSIVSKHARNYEELSSKTTDGPGVKRNHFNIL